MCVKICIISNTDRPIYHKQAEKNQGSFVTIASLYINKQNQTDSLQNQHKQTEIKCFAYKNNMNKHIERALFTKPT